MWRLVLSAICVIGLLQDCRPVAAEERPTYVSVDAGGYGAITGPDKRGWAASAHLFPGGRLARFGLRADWRSLGDSSGVVTGGLAFEAAAARPRLQLSLHGDVGATLDSSKPVAGAGIRASVWIIGPLYAALDGGGLLYYDGVDSSLSLGTSVLIGLGNPGSSP